MSTSSFQLDPRKRRITPGIIASENQLYGDDADLLNATRPRLAVPSSATPTPPIDTQQIESGPRLPSVGAASLQNIKPEIPIWQPDTVRKSSPSLFNYQPEWNVIDQAERLPRAQQADMSLPDALPDRSGYTDRLVPYMEAQRQLAPYKPYLDETSERRAYNEAVKTNDTPDNRHRNFGQKLLHVLGGIGKGFALGGVGGAVAGGIDPGNADRAIQRAYVLPRLQSQAQESEALQGKRLNQQLAIEDQTGYNAAGPTAGERQRQIGNEFNRYKQSELEENRQARLSNEQQRIQETTRQHKEESAKNAVSLAAKLRRPVDRASVAGTSYEPFAGAVPPPDMSDLDRTVDTFGKYRVPVPSDIVQGTPYAPLAGRVQPEKPDYEGVRIARQADRDARTDENDRRRFERDAEKDYNDRRRVATKTEGELSTARAALKVVQGKVGKADSSGKVTTEDEVAFMEDRVRQMQADADDAWYEAQEAAKTLQSEHGWNVTVKDGRYPNAQRPRQQRRSAASPSPGSAGIATQAHVDAYAKARGITQEAARKQIESEGYVIR